MPGVRQDSKTRKFCIKRPVETAFLAVVVVSLLLGITLTAAMLKLSITLRG